MRNYLNQKANGQQLILLGGTSILASKAAGLLAQFSARPHGLQKGIPALSQA